MNILVTGGAGYIGSHAVRLLDRHGHRVRIYDNFSTGYKSLVSSFEVVEGETGDYGSLCQALRDIDLVMHFAASAYVGESVSHPRKYFTNNVVNGLALLHAVMDAGVRNFIFSSTCAVYGAPVTVPITEEAPCRPANPYGESKLFLERALEAYERAYGLRSVRLRYFNAAGCDPDAGIGEAHQPETHLIPLALEVAAGVRDSLEIYGNDYDTPDGTCIRDYTHVQDLVSAHVQATDYLARGGASCSLNLGTGKGHSVADVVSGVERVTGRKVRVKIARRREGDPPVLVADATRAARVLGWHARYSLDDILRSAWGWQNSREYRSLINLQQAIAEN